MCTAIVDGHLFGRTLDLEESYGEQIVVVGRKFPLRFIHEGEIYNHTAIIGTAHIENQTPLFYDATNEMGLCAAALRFPKFCTYHEKNFGSVNLAPFELIPWVLSRFASAAEAKEAMRSLNITNENFSDSLPSTPLHWIFADKYEAFVIESVGEGIKIYDAPEGILTNAPDFASQRENLAKHGDIFSNSCRLGEKSIEIAGDGSSTSRFIRASYAKENTLPENDKSLAISRFFHIMSTVSLPHGYSRGIGDKPMKTLYTSCIDTKELVYYFTTYTCRQIHGVRLIDFKLDSDKLVTLSMPREEKISYID